MISGPYIDEREMRFLPCRQDMSKPATGVDNDVESPLPAGEKDSDAPAPGRVRATGEFP